MTDAARALRHRIGARLIQCTMDELRQIDDALDAIERARHGEEPDVESDLEDLLEPAHARIAAMVADLPLIDPEPGWEGRVLERLGFGSEGNHRDYDLGGEG